MKYAIRVHYQRWFLSVKCEGFFNALGKNRGALFELKILKLFYQHVLPINIMDFIVELHVIANPMTIFTHFTKISCWVCSFKGGGFWYRWGKHFLALLPCAIFA